MNKSNIISLALGLSLIGCGSANGFLGKEDKKASADVIVQHSEKNAALDAYLQNKDSAVLYKKNDDAICKKEDPGHTDPGGDIAPMPAPALLAEEEHDLNNIDYGDSKPDADACEIEPGIDFISVLVCSAGGAYSVIDSNGKVYETKEVKESCVKHICYQTYRSVGEQVPAIFHEGQEDKPYVSEPKSLLEETELVWVCEEDGINQNLPEGSSPGGEGTVDPEDAE